MATHHARTGLGALALVGSIALGVAACQTGVGVGEATDTASPTASAVATDASPTPSVEPTTEESADPSAGVGTTNGPNTVTAPQDGSTVAGPTVTVSGQGTAFEATLSYQVLVAGTEDVVSEGFTNGGANGEVGPFTFDLELAPGTYTVQVWEPDMSDGEGSAGPYLNLVEVSFTVS